MSGSDGDDAELLRWVASEFDARADRWQKRAQRVGQSVGALPVPGVWEGDLAQNLGTSANAIAPDLAAIASTARQAAAATRAYASRLDAIEAEEAALAPLRREVIQSTPLLAAPPSLMTTEADRVSQQRTEEHAELARAKLKAREASISVEREAAQRSFVAAIGAVRVPVSTRESQFAEVRLFSPIDSSDITLDQVSSLDAAELATLLTLQVQRDRIASLLSEKDPQTVAAWWSGLGQTIDPVTGKVTMGAQQLAMVAGMPAVIGNLDGVSYIARDAANRIELTRLHDRVLAGKLTGDQADAVNGVWKAMTVGGKLVTLDPPRELIGFEPARPGAQISVGDLDAASYVTYQIPGVDTKVASGMSGLVKVAQVQYHQEVDLLNSRSMVGGRGVAVVAWLDFEPPAAIEAPFNDTNAAAGGQFLAKDVSGLGAVQHSLGNVSVRNNISTLSYGSLTAQKAALIGMPVDSLSMHGDIGITSTNVVGFHVPDVNSVHDFTLNPGADVYQTHFTVDYTSEVGHGVSPGARLPTSAFGATTLGADGYGTETASSSHSWMSGDPSNPGYADSNTESSVNQAKVSLGLLDELTDSGHPVVEGT